MSRFTSASTAALLGAVILSCDKSPTRPSTNPTNNPPPSTPATLLSIRIDGPSTVPPGETAQYTATGSMSNGTSSDVTSTVTWRTSNTNVMTISRTGLATAGQAGQVTISADQTSRRASTSVTVIPAGTFVLTGTVREAGYPVIGATVSLLNGSRPVLSAGTDGGGGYRLFGVVGDVEVRATKNGYVERVNRLIVSSNTTSDFELAQERRTDVFGKYQLTVTAAPQCTSLPAEARSRTYDAEITQDGPSLKVALSSSTLIAGSFTGRTEPTSVTFNIRGVDTYYYYYFTQPFDLVDQLTPTTALMLAGHVTTTNSSSGLSGTLAGVFATVQSPIAAFPRTIVTCSGNHPFVFTRR